MSEDNHPNINAAGFTADVIAAFLERIRGEAKKAKMGDSLGVLRPLLVDFVAKVSTALDDKFDTGEQGWRSK